MNRNNSHRQDHESLDDYYQRLRETSDREDLVMFVNACFAATRQNEYYTDRQQQSVSIEFLHQYVMANYRRLYARTLALGINHFNQALIIQNMLGAGAPADPIQRAEEGNLIATALQHLPPNRVFALFKSLQRDRVNNRRARAVVKRYLKWRNDPVFDAVKYRNKIQSAIAHSHLKVESEVGAFLFDFKKTRRYQTPLLDNYRKAHYSATAIYDLPFTIAESLATKHAIPRKVFFKKIEPKMTAAEKLRYQASVDRTRGVRLDFDLARAPLTKLALFLLSLPMAQRVAQFDDHENALRQSAKRALKKAPVELGRVAVVLDDSRSSRGSLQKRNRPLGVAIGVSYFLQEAATEFQSFWTSGRTPKADFLVDPKGQTKLVDSVLEAFDWKPGLLIIVSDGYENDPPKTVDHIAELYMKNIGSKLERPPEILHLNPVFDSEHYSPLPFGTYIPVVGIREAEDITTMLGFARFASGDASLDELHQYLGVRMDALMAKQKPQRRRTQ